jgi:3-phosphoshikimate 1-carboxyvinyltransferase
MNINISHPGGEIKGTINLPASKSESNRLLILQALSQGAVKARNLSDARDTDLMQAALTSGNGIIDVRDAGTTMRFLTAYFCATGQHKVLTGTERMCERPIGILVDALREIGFKINYKKNEGYPPLEIMPCDMQQLKNDVHLAGDISSQYISALLMIAPILPGGLTLHFTTHISSAPYVEMTLSLMAQAGIAYTRDGDSILIARQDFKPKAISASADWSSASYWYSVAVLARSASIKLKGLSLSAPQGDKKIAEWMLSFGVETKQEDDGILLTKKASAKITIPVGMNFDFADYPDLAQTLIVICAAKGIDATFTGMDSLRIKETDRIAALESELAKCSVSLVEKEKGIFALSGSIAISAPGIVTHGDHRMAMAFAPLSLLGSMTILNGEVVNKSYPDFWKDMAAMNFKIA